MKTVVISLGGSTFVQEKINTSMLLSLQEILQQHKNTRFIIVCGGGKTARNYITAAKDLECSDHQQSLIAIDATRLNASFVKVALGDEDPLAVTIEDLLEESKHKHIIVTGALYPKKTGITTDTWAARIASMTAASQVINMTNVDGLFTKDPRKYDDATLIKNISYADLHKMMKEQLQEGPGQHFIFDTTGLEIVHKNKISLIILLGVDNLKKALDSQEFVGTVIQ